jgi:threonine dehydrogenase-like Zn-dependent dehydrogenase
VATSGAGAALRDCILAAKRYARISILSFYEKDLDGLPIDPLVHGCLKIVGGAGCYGNAPAVCEIMRQNPVKLTPCISHHVPFAECMDVFVNEEKYHKEKIKIMIDFD